MAHEINNPLFAILGLVEFLLKDAEVGTKGHDRLVLVQRTALEIKEIVRALLDFAREPSDERVAVSVTDAARETAELFRRTSAAKSSELRAELLGREHRRRWKRKSVQADISQPLDECHPFHRQRRR